MAERAVNLMMSHFEAHVKYSREFAIFTFVAANAIKLNNDKYQFKITLLCDNLDSTILLQRQISMHTLSEKPLKLLSMSSIVFVHRSDLIE